MKTFFRYAWPVFFVMAIQGFTLTFPAKSSGLQILRLSIFAVVDLFIAWAQRYQYRKDLAFKAEMEALRAGRRFGS